MEKNRGIQIRKKKIRERYTKQDTFFGLRPVYDMQKYENHTQTTCRSHTGIGEA
jgi:hypothetical protein